MGRPRTPIGAHGTVNVVETARGRWRARAYCRFPDGRRRQVERFGPSRARAVASLKAALVDVATPTLEDLSSTTRLAQLARQFLALKVDKGLAPTSIAAYESTITGIVLPRIGDLRIGEATPARLQAFFTAVTKEHGPGAAKMTRAVMSGMFALAVRSDACRTNPVASIERIQRGPSRAAVALRPEAVRDFITVVGNDPELVRADLSDLLRFMVLTGCRMGEALALRWDQVDLGRATVTFNGTVVRIKGQGLLRQQHGKTIASTRTISVPEEAVRILRARTQRGDMVFPSATGSVRDPVDAESGWRRHRDRLGYPGMTSHALRKTCATALDVAGLSARAIAEYLGHASPSITQDVYMSRNVGSADAAAKLTRMYGVSTG